MSHPIETVDCDSVKNGFFSSTEKGFRVHEHPVISYFCRYSYAAVHLQHHENTKLKANELTRYILCMKLFNRRLYGEGVKDLSNHMLTVSTQKPAGVL